MSDQPSHSDLPLTPATFSVLATLASGSRAGFEILEAIEDTGARILGPGTLYRVLRDLRKRGWIERVPAPARSSVTDERVQYHELTAAGRRIVEAEASRLRRTLLDAGLLRPSGEGS